MLSRIASESKEGVPQEMPFAAALFVILLPD
jgi:hypothetical protein